MTWVRIDDGYHRNPKVRAAGLHARALHLAGLCWTAANLTNGHIPHGVIDLIAVEAQVKASFVDKLVTAGLWDDVEGGWQIHDYLEYNRPADAIKAERQAAAERQRRAREAAAQKRHGTTPVTDMSHRESRRDNGVSHGPPDPTRPDPTPTDVLKSPPPPKDSSGETDAGGGWDIAINHAVDHQQRTQAGAIANPAAWRKAVRRRIAAEHGPRIRQLLADGHTPEQAAARILDDTPTRTHDPHAAARSMVAGLIATGETPDATFTEALSSHPHAYEAITDELATRTGWTPPEINATVTPIRPTTIGAQA